ncbi:MAG: sulfite exporter TauE/SafE family protein [Pirellulales bacterium]
MVELPLIFVGGLLGSAHCVGMCGGFALLVGANTRNLSANLARQLLYSAGRISTYAVVGAVVGYGGVRLAALASPLVNLQALLSIVAGGLLVMQGLHSAGWLPLRRLSGASSSCPFGGSLGSLLRSGGATAAFLAGVFTGFLPCGLVYAYLALATSAGGLWQGWLTMACFGLGTVPLMVLTGSGGSLLSIVNRQRVLRVAAICVVVTGMISLARGAGALQFGDANVTSACPLCR